MCLDNSWEQKIIRFNTKAENSVFVGENGIIFYRLISSISDDNKNSH
jgi:hypothetical protein